MSKKTRNILIGAIAVMILVLVTSPRLKIFNSGTGNAGTGTVRDVRIPVTAVIIRPEPVQNKILTTGTVLANEEVELKSEISGKITGIFFKEGTSVKKGALLAKINDAELQATLLKLQSQQKLAEDKERRRRMLFEKQNISPEDYEITLNELNSIKAEVELIKARIDKTEIRAPFDGNIGLRFVSEGSYVSTDTRMASLQDMSQVKIDFAVPEKYATSLRREQMINFSVAGSKDRYRGKIYAIAPKIDPVTRTVHLRALSPNRDGRIVPGAFAEVELILQELGDALMVPTEALIPEMKGHKLFLHRGGIAHGQGVETGLRTDTKVQVTSGLQSGDTVITSGILQLVQGTPVRLTEIH